MNTRISSSWYLVTAVAILVAVLLAGCTGTNYAPAPVTTPATPVTTSAPATPAATTVVTTTTMAQTTVATMPPATTTTAPPTTPIPSTVDVSLQNFAFVPPSVTISKGTTITWTNLDSAPHTIISDATTLFQTGAMFRSNQLLQGQKYSFTFNTEGTFAYHCSIHPFMTGTITVT